MNTPAILIGKIIPDGDNGKEMFFVADTNDGYNDLRLTLDTDDCNQAFARKWMKRIRDCVAACRGMEKPQATVKALKTYQMAVLEILQKHTHPIVDTQTQRDGELFINIAAVEEVKALLIK